MACVHMYIHYFTHMHITYMYILQHAYGRVHINACMHACHCSACLVLIKINCAIYHRVQNYGRVKLTNQSFQSFGEENVDEFSIANISYYSNLGKLIVIAPNFPA